MCSKLTEGEITVSEVIYNQLLLEKELGSFKPTGRPEFSVEKIESFVAECFRNNNYPPEHPAVQFLKEYVRKKYMGGIPWY